jgi:hypothetical protein
VRPLDIPNTAASQKDLPQDTKTQSPPIATGRSLQLLRRHKPPRGQRRRHKERTPSTLPLGAPSTQIHGRATPLTMGRIEKLHRHHRPGTVRVHHHPRDTYQFPAHLPDSRQHQNRQSQSAPRGPPRTREQQRGRVSNRLKSPIHRSEPPHLPLGGRGMA